MRQSVRYTERKMKVAVAAIVSLGALSGVIAVVFISSVYAPSVKDGSDLLNGRHPTVLSLGGTIVSVDKETFILKNEDGREVRVRYDNRTATLLRNLATDKAGIVSTARLLVGPKEDILKEGRVVRVNVWVEEKMTIPYALMAISWPKKQP